MAMRRRKYRKRRKESVDSKKIEHPTGSPPHHSFGAFSPTDKASDSGAGVYHSHLHASLQAFRARKWRPLTPDTAPRSTVTRCRPISGRPSSAGQALVPRPPTEQRPDRDSIDPSAVRSSTSTNVTSIYPRRPDTPRVSPGNFDTLTPRILSHLVTDSRPTTPNSTYGDAIHPNQRRNTSKKSERRKKTEEEIFNDSSSAFSISDDDNDDESSSDDDDDDNDSISELERGLEPTLDRRRKAPDLQLRPEQLDHVYVPENKRDMRRFDFDAEKTEIPIYEFECPIPPPLDKINVRLHARENTNWRFAPANMSSGPDEDPQLGAILDRLVEIEKRQIETEEWEEKRLKSSRKRVPSRAGGSANSRRRDKRCCSSCLQACCVGDCPNKKPGHPMCCESCHQPLCTGSCADTRYEQRMRHPRDTIVTSLPPRLPPPKNCRTCQRRHNAKYINANHVVLGRPKSAFSTYSRGQKSSKPKDLRPKSAMNIERTISQKIEELGLDPRQQATSYSTTPSTPPGRNGLMPGKTYFSNLSRSLTDLSSKRRCKSAKMRRPRSRAALSKSIQNDV